MTSNQLPLVGHIELKCLNLKFKECTQKQNRAKSDLLFEENSESRAQFHPIDPIIILGPNRGKQETEK